jgi:hypothetical protein
VRALRVLDPEGRVLERRAVRADAAAFRPGSHEIALLLTDGHVVVGPRIVFSAGARLEGLTWSPDGRWLLAAWPSADQWVFVRVAGARRIESVSNLRAQFDGVPKVLGWTSGSG